MENLIMNPQWRPGPDGNPMYFSGNGLTYDKRIYQGNRTCSISRMETSPEPGLISYDPPIVVAGKSAVVWGFYIRAVEASNIILTADFYNEEGMLLKKFHQPIAQRVTAEFKPVTCRFPFPLHAHIVHLSMQFNGKVTACTFFLPTAYLV